MLANKIRTVLAATTIAAFTFAATASFAQDVKVPETTADHEALAKSYKDQAAQYRKTAQDHKQMAEAYKAKAAKPKTGDNPWVTKMNKHCQMLAKDAEKLATDADKAAEFHTLRGKELQGK